MVMTVLLADLPCLLDDIISGALEGDEGVRLVRNARTGGNLAAAALGVHADVIVVTRKDPGDLASIDQHMAGLAGRSLLALRPAGDCAWLYCCRCEATQLRELSMTTLLEVMQKCSSSANPRS
jgi:hypothetical protein